MRRSSMYCFPLQLRSSFFSEDLFPCERFDEETADELVQPKEARRKNDRFKRFKLGDETSSSEDEDFEDEK